MPAPRTANELVQVVLKSELVERKQLLEHIEKLKTSNMVPGDAMEYAQLMVFDGLITQFQSKLLLQGKWKNFFLGGKYKILEHLGTGGMGSVFLCEHRHMRRRVAIKVLPPDKSALPTVLQRFRREAQAVAMLNHPNIVRAHDIDQDGMMHYIVMEYVEGVNLQQLVDEHGPLSITRAVNYLTQAADGLQHAHESRLVHRDIKPSNLLLDRQGFVKILDLGLARFNTNDPDMQLTQLANDKSVLGTVDYLSPEQARDATQVDIRADIYSLGGTAYFLLTGKPLFDAPSIAHKLIAHQTTAAKPIDSLRRDVPKPLADVIFKMVEKEPTARWQTPREVAKALAPWFKPVPPPTPEELPAQRFSTHRDMDTLSRPTADRTLSTKSDFMLDIR